jgi:CRISPR-associated protein Cas2
VALTVVITYDISNNDQRARVAARLGRFGLRIQKSVFECVIDPEELDALLNTITAMINVEHDVVHAFPICRLCHENARHLGQAAPVLEERYWIV